MSSSHQEIISRLQGFLRVSGFKRNGAIITDLDGTAVNDVGGRAAINRLVEFGLRRLYQAGHPLVLNSLRFPLSVLRDFGKEWFAVTSSPLPTVTLNGSLIGIIDRTSHGEITFKEVDACPLRGAEIEKVLAEVEDLRATGAENVLLFFYPRDWRMGEIIWTPIPARLAAVKEKYVSDSGVTSVEIIKLRRRMLAEQVCMIHLRADVPEDRLMAYQHTQRAGFFSRDGVSKLSGAFRAAHSFGFELEHSVGAGDTEMDDFLSGVGLAVIVGDLSPRYEGRIETIRVGNPAEFGGLLDGLHRLITQWK